jgi:small subunit ribosomal protein S20
MANHPSAWKRMRQDKKKRLRNISFRSRTKTAIKKYLVAVDSGEGNAGQTLSEATSLLQRSVAKGVMHRNTASRKIARLAKKMHAAAKPD